MFAGWPTAKIVVFLVPFGLIVVAAVAWLLLRNTIMTRLTMVKQLRNDPDIEDWLVVFNWTRKVLYLPTVVASLVAFVLMNLHEHQYLTSLDPYVLGGIWLAVFFVNFLIDEYEIGVMVLLITALGLLAGGLWLQYMDWLKPFLAAFARLRFSINSIGYLVIALIFLLAIVISWLKGLFYYVAITPNYLNIKSGPTESAEQVSREEFGTRIDTGDFLERCLGFGRIVITFSSPHRPPLLLLVGRIGRKAVQLETVRSKLAIEHGQTNHERKEGSQA